MSASVADLGRKPHDEALALLAKFVSDPNIKPAWEKLRNRPRRGSPRLEGNPLYDRAVFYLCRNAMREWCQQPKEATSEKRKTLKRIIKKVNDLKELVESSMYFPDFTLGELLTDHEFLDLADVLNIGYFQDPKRHSDGNPLFDIDQKTRGGLCIYLRAASRTNMPSLEALLARFSKEVETKSTLSNPIAKPKSKRAEAHYVARHLAHYFLSEYGVALHEICATITNVAVGSNLERDDVRKLTLDLMNGRNAKLLAKRRTHNQAGRTSRRD